MKPRLYGIALGLLVAVVFLRAGDYFARRGHVLPSPPDPNGYDLLVTAGAMVAPTHGSLLDLTEETLKDLAQKNAPALET